MKKLRNKIFFTIFILLSSFLISILILFNFQSYNLERRNVENGLNRIHNLKEVQIEKNPSFNKTIPGDIQEDQRADDFSEKIFMDLEVYTIILSEENEIMEIVSHKGIESQEEAEELEAIETLGTNIIKKQTKKVTYIGNLYFSRYSYTFLPGNYITIMDNEEIQSSLFSVLRESIFLFLLAELVIFYLSKVLMRWITVPVEESFLKQKQFIADASHELKTPLSVIMASSDALMSDPLEEKWLRNIKNESIRMNKLISSLLDLAKIEAEEVVGQYNLQDLSKIVEMQILTFESLAFEQGLTFQYEIEKDISFYGNSDQLKQLVSILLDNAIKHSEKKSNIQVKLFSKKNEISLKVMNHGKEIPLEEREKIFERFYRMDKSRNREENRYGLGLAIAKGIVEHHHGIIRVNCNEGVTSFEVILKKTYKE